MMNAKPQSRAEREQKTWSALFEYANTGGFRDFVRAVRVTFNYIGGDLSDIASCEDVALFLKSARVKYVGFRQPEVQAALRHMAKSYHGLTVTVLEWLADPERRRELAAPAGEILRLNAGGVALEIKGQSDFGTGPKYQILLKETPGSCSAVIGPVCLFIRRQIERHDIGGEPLRDVIPVGQCGRPDCKKFRLLKINRSGIGFCSSLCRASFHQQQRSKKERARYMAEYRKRVQADRLSRTRRRRRP